MLYRLILKLRHRRYDRKSEESAVPSICIGNVTVGGTGKTPHCELLLRLLEQRAGVAVLSRGYKRKSKGFALVQTDGSASDFGDEPLQIKRKFPQRTVAVDEDRLEGCRKLKALGAKLVILDDAFQHRRLRATRNIVLVNYSRPVFEDRLLPFGRLRDLPERIFKADCIIVSKCPKDILDSEKAAFAFRLKLRDYNPATCRALTPEGKEILLLFSYIRYLEPQMAFPEGDRRYIYDKNILYINGIAKDPSLRKHLLQEHRIVEEFSFRDHHDFSRRDLQRIEKEACKYSVCALATTEKDAQRIIGKPWVSDALKKRLFIIPIEAVLSNEAEEKALEEIISLA
ncbi:MAG: tetraacyldisaccharide 4'-kinase [Candidatus Cryptobacteroides sp.]